MLNTTKQLRNEAVINNLLKEIVLHSYEELKEEDILLCLECCDVDLEIATSQSF